MDVSKAKASPTSSRQDVDQQNGATDGYRDIDPEDRQMRGSADERCPDEVDSRDGLCLEAPGIDDSMAHHEIEKVANRKRDEQTYQESDGWRHLRRQHVENNQLTLMVGDAYQQEALPDKDVATQLFRPDQGCIENIAGEHLHDHDDDNGQHGSAGDKPHDVSVPHQDKRSIRSGYVVRLHARYPARAAIRQSHRKQAPAGLVQCPFVPTFAPTCSCDRTLEAGTAATGSWTRGLRDQAVAWAAVTNSAISGDFLVHSPMIGSTFDFMAGRSSRAANCTPFFFRSSRAAKS